MEASQIKDENINPIWCIDVKAKKRLMFSWRKPPYAPVISDPTIDNINKVWLIENKVHNFITISWTKPQKKPIFAIVAKINVIGFVAPS